MGSSRRHEQFPSEQRPLELTKLTVTLHLMPKNAI